MPKCIVCGKRGIFLKVTNGLCPNCLTHAQQQIIAANSSNAPKQKMSVTGKCISQDSNLLAISKYSPFPRYYIINGVQYDIDDSNSIHEIPIFDSILEINGNSYGMDTILYEHYRQCSDTTIGYAAYEKCQQFRKKGIVNLSDWEKEVEKRSVERKQKERDRKKQCNSFTIDDMYQFTGIPFGWSYVMSLMYTDGIPWFTLNLNNQQVALYYISQINDIIVDAREYIPAIGNAYIDLGQIDFDYPVPMTKQSMCNTRVECYPYTVTGKVSKYPVVLVFATKYISNEISFIRNCSGEIKIMRDGSIGSALVYLNGKNYRFSLHGVSLVLKRVDDRITGSNLYYFSESNE